MDEKQPGPESDEEAVPRLLGFLGLLLILVGQIFLYTYPVQDGVIVPVYVWIDIAGMVLFILGWRYSASGRELSISRRLWYFPIGLVGANDGQLRTKRDSIAGRAGNTRFFEPDLLSTL